MFNWFDNTTAVFSVSD